MVGQFIPVSVNKKFGLVHTYLKHKREEEDVLRLIMMLETWAKLNELAPKYKSNTWRGHHNDWKFVRTLVKWKLWFLCTTVMVLYSFTYFPTVGRQCAVILFIFGIQTATSFWDRIGDTFQKTHSSFSMAVLGRKQLWLQSACEGTTFALEV